jgi:WD40 repeat protein
MGRAGKRMIVAVAASIAVILIGTLVFLRANSQRPRTLKIQIGFISSIAFSPDGRMLAISGSDGRVQLWDTAHGKWLRSLYSYRNSDWVVFSADGHTLVSWGADSGHQVVLWDALSGDQLRVFGDDANPAGEAAFSPDGRVLATDASSQGSDAGGIQLWDVASGSEVRRLPGYVGPVFSPDGKLLAARNKNRSISLLDVESGNEVRTFSAHQGLFSPNAIFSPDGRLLASTNNSMVTVWDVASGQEVRNIYDSALVRGIAFSPDSRLLASGSEDHTIKLWDVASGNKVRTLSGHFDSVNCVAFSPDGRLLASGAADGNVILWPLPQSR